MTISTYLSGFSVFRRSLTLALGSLLLASSASVFAAAGDGSLSDPNIRYVGRWDKSQGWVYTSNWGGAYLTTKFTGKTITLKLAKSVKYFDYVIDGQFNTYWPSNGNTNITLSASSYGTHTLEVSSSWEDLQLQVLGLGLEPGQRTIAPDQRPLIEFIGDSITAGRSTYNWQNDAGLDYAWLTGEALGADHTQIAVSGIPLVSKNYYTEGPYIGMDRLYFRALSGKDCRDAVCTNNPLWDFSRYSPNLIVINLGTNDANLGVSANDFQWAYLAFLKNVRDKHPNAEIFVLETFNAYFVPPAQNTTYNVTLYAVNARIAAGDHKLHYVDTTGWVQHPADFADYFHPNAAGHRKIMGRLAPILKPYLTGQSNQTGQSNLLSNPGFENGLNNWGAWPAGNWQYVDTSSPHSGTHNLTQLNANGAYGATFTQLSGLSSGLYTATAWVRGSGGQQMYVKDSSGSTQKNLTIPASNSYTQVVIRDINITSGKAEIGFWTSADWQGKGWLNVDDVTFSKQ